MGQIKIKTSNHDLHVIGSKKDLIKFIGPLIFDHKDEDNMEDIENELKEEEIDFVDGNKIKIDSIILESNDKKKAVKNKKLKKEHGGKIGFDKLAAKIAREYEKKGISPKKAKLFGVETAAKVKREKENK